MAASGNSSATRRCTMDLNRPSSAITAGAWPPAQRREWAHPAAMLFVVSCSAARPAYRSAWFDPSGSQGRPVFLPYIEARYWCLCLRQSNADFRW